MEGYSIPNKRKEKHLVETDPQGLQRVAFREEGWKYYDWRGYRTHYIEAGEGPPIVLVHGFGGHAYHWRYTIAEFAKTHRVYSICLLGYGWSEKAVCDYSGDMWGEQVVDFVHEIIGSKEPVVIAGNSIGCIASLYAAHKLGPSNVRGLAFLNAAGKYVTPGVRETRAEPSEILTVMKGSIMAPVTKVLTIAIFYLTKLRIEKILKQVYANHHQVDSDLVWSIIKPAQDPQARAAFCKIAGAGRRTKSDVNELLAELEVPLLVLHGSKDPWMTPKRAEIIVQMYENSTYRLVESAGHCPMDDSPEDAHMHLRHWMESVGHCDSRA